MTELIQEKAALLGTVRQKIQPWLIGAATLAAAAVLTGSRVGPIPAPFGAALAVALPEGMLMLAAAGSVFGALISLSAAERAKQIAAVVAVVLVRMLLRRQKMQKNLPRLQVRGRCCARRFFYSFDWADDLQTA